MGYYPCLHVFPSRNVFLKHPKKHHKIASFQHLLSSLQIIISRHPKSSQIIISITSKHQKHQFYQNTQKASKRQFGSVQSVQIIKSINSIPSNHQITSNHPKSSNQSLQIINKPHFGSDHFNHFKSSDHIIKTPKSISFHFIQVTSKIAHRAALSGRVLR